MKDLLRTDIDQFRYKSNQVLKMYGSFGDDTCGCFLIPSKIDRAELFVVAAAGGGWDHVSVSRSNRCPNWIEMEQIKRLFFKDDEVAVQFHVPPSDHINKHEFCLHLWRSRDQPFPMPPKEFVG